MNEDQPAVGICVADMHACAEIAQLARDLGIHPMLYDPDDRARWATLIDAVSRDGVVCVVDDDPDMVILATSMGVHAMVFQPPAYFSWHLVMRDTGEDARQALAYRLKEWTYKRDQRR